MKNKYHNLRWHPVIGLVLLFVAFVLTGMLFGLIYTSLMDGFVHLAARILAPLLFGAIMAFAVYGFKWVFKVTYNIPAFFVILCGCAAVYFFMWGEFPLRGAAEFFSFESLELPELFMRIIGERELTVIFNRIIAVSEVLVLTVPLLYIAFKPAGVFLKKYNRWAKLRIMDYGFIPFTDRELDKLAAGSMDIFVRKPIDLTGLKRIHAVALCYVDDTLTEYLAVFKADWNKRGQIEKGSRLLLAVLTVEQTEELQNLLYEIHRENYHED